MMKSLIAAWIIISFTASSLMLPERSFALEQLNLPVPGTMVNLSPAFVPVLIKGLKVHPENPLLFDFILDTGNSGLKINSLAFKAESQKLIKYFLASLTIKEDDLWVNLSPYEKNRIIPDELGKTQLGIDMLAQDYILKQLTASLIYPEKRLGKEFWDRIYAKAQEIYGTSDVPVNTFNKVWIVADKARILQRNNVGYVVGEHLKVMLEEDYMALENHTAINLASNNKTHTVASGVVREIIIPELQKEVNGGKNFAPLRQMFYSMILASWYKLALKNALLNQVYSNKKKTGGILSDDPKSKERIYELYLRAYKKGVFNYIKEDFEIATKQTIPRKYFSGGIAVARKPDVGENLRQGDDFSPKGAMAIVAIKADIIAAPNHRNSSPAMISKPLSQLKIASSGGEGANAVSTAVQSLVNASVPLIQSFDWDSYAQTNPLIRRAKPGNFRSTWDEIAKIHAYTGGFYQPILLPVLGEKIKNLAISLTEIIATNTAEYAELTRQIYAIGQLLENSSGDGFTVPSIELIRTMSMTRAGRPTFPPNTSLDLQSIIALATEGIGIEFFSALYQESTFDKFQEDKSNLRADNILAAFKERYMSTGVHHRDTSVTDTVPARGRTNLNCVGQSALMAAVLERLRFKDVYYVKVGNHVKLLFRQASGFFDIDPLFGTLNPTSYRIPTPMPRALKLGDSSWILSSWRAGVMTSFFANLYGYLNTERNYAKAEEVKRMRAFIFSNGGYEEDRAMGAVLPTHELKRPIGGIDLNSKNMRLDVSGQGINMRFDPAMLAQFQQGDFTGIVPFIVSITPIASALPILGLQNNPA